MPAAYASRWLPRLAVVLAVSFLPSPARAQVDWHPKDLGTLGSMANQRSFAQDLNDAGVVVGFSDVDSKLLSPPTYDNHAFLWSPASGMIDLGTLGGPQSIAEGINNSGQVVGWSRIAGQGLTTYHAFLWSAGNGMVDLGVLGGFAPFSIARDINDAGQVVGLSTVSTGLDTHAFLWSASTGLTDLGTLGGPNSQAIAINNSGRVVGWSHTANLEIHPFMWTAAGGMVALGMLNGATSSQALGINQAGQVVGRSGIGTDPQRWRPFLWTAARGMVEIGALDTVGGWASPVAINESGQIAGFGTDYGPFRAALWEPSEDLVLDFWPAVWRLDCT
jgi:probable HAF family extracellular repeat protein